MLSSYLLQDVKNKEDDLNGHIHAPFPTKHGIKCGPSPENLDNFEKQLTRWLPISLKYKKIEEVQFNPILFL